MAIAVFLAGGALFWVIVSRQVIRPLRRLAAFSLTVGQPRAESSAGVRRLAGLSDRADQMGHPGRSLERMERVIQERLHDLCWTRVGPSYRRSTPASCSIESLNRRPTDAPSSPSIGPFG